MRTVEQQIMEDYRRRMMALNTSYESSIRATAHKFGLKQGEVRQVINKLAPKRTTDGVAWEEVDSQYEGMRTFIIYIQGQEVIWHTRSGEKEIKDKIKKLKHRRAIEM